MGVVGETLARIPLQESDIIWAGVCTSILIMAILISPEDRRKVMANWYLAAFIFFLSLRLTVRFLVRSDYVPIPGPLTTLGLSSELLLGPCLYFYVLSLTKSAQPNGMRFLLHWMPGGLGVLLSLGMLLPLQGDAASFSSLRGQAPQLNFVVWHLPFIISLLSYSVMSLRLLRLHGRQIREQFSNLKRIDLTWLRWLCGILIVAALGLFIQSPEGMSKSAWQSALYVLLIYYIGFMGIRQPAIFQPQAGERIENGSDPLPQPIQSIDAKLPINSRELWDSLQALLETEQPYRRPNINLARLAELLGVPPYQLSAVINHHGNCSFFDLINRLRVESAKALLLDEACRLNILDIGLESGFNSKSTFYYQFKKSTGKTPSEFRAGSNSRNA